MFSCLKDRPDNLKVLDFGAGTGWISEWLNRMGYEVTAFDINEDLPRIGQMRVECDKRVNPDQIHFQCGDGHNMPFEDNTFGHICCFDSLHHMHNYAKVLSEYYRVLTPGGRAIFVEPGAKHSTSKETVEFIEKHKKNDPTWIERDVVLEEIYQIARECGFGQLTIRPVLFPHLREYDFDAWQRFRKGDQHLEADYVNWLKVFNYDSHLSFYLDKNPPPQKENSINRAKAWLGKQLRKRNSQIFEIE
jgi:ubiquinone/menaquinone biosynthesis C-methylase UbiE